MRRIPRSAGNQPQLPARLTIGPKPANKDRDRSAIRLRMIKRDIQNRAIRPGQRRVQGGIPARDKRIARGRIRSRGRRCMASSAKDKNCDKTAD